MSVSAVFFPVMVAVFTVACLVMDLRARRIPNWLTVPAFALGLLAHTVNGGLAGLAFSFLGFLTGFGILFVLWLIGGGGGGDVKMMGALGAWLGSWLTLMVFIASAMVTLVMVGALIAYNAYKKNLMTALRRCTGRAVREANAARSQPTKGKGDGNSRPGRVLPYAVPIAVGTWIVLALAAQGVSVFGVSF